MIAAKANCFISFQQATDTYTLPERFTFPFYYEPHPLCLLAVKELQQHLETQTEWQHNFGIVPGKEGLIIGKMFGVLVVQNQAGELGYLAAFSGKLANGNHHDKFVPPVFDMLTDGSFFRVGEIVVNGMTTDLQILEANPEYQAFKAIYDADKKLSISRLKEAREKMRIDKKERKERRQAAKSELSGAAYQALDHEMSQASIKAHFYWKDLKKYWKERLAENEVKFAELAAPINDLKEARKAKSNSLQKQLFEQYTFLNATGVTKNLLDIFAPTPRKIPPAGAGECAAPKLLHYAFLHQLKPIAMAEFWWGQSPKSEVRRHGHFYPACRGKCEPILGHMLQGLEVDKNPMLTNPAEGKKLEIIYEDKPLLVVHKPAEFLSVPGKNIQDSVYQRIKDKYPKATGPLVVHRLDMSTSGLMLIAKSEKTHKYIQYQFINRFVKKRYVALLDGIIEADEGVIELPLRVDLDNRPQQLVCYEHGKNAKTEWKVIERKAGKTRIHFFPITGRTHQLRVHAAHPLGLNTPIVGDDLYGVKGERLHLHAEWIEFRHPLTKETVSFEVGADF